MLLKHLRGFVILACLSVRLVSADTVYLSATGVKYHAKTCRTMKYAPTPIERKVAEKRGIAACKVCRP